MTHPPSTLFISDLIGCKIITAEGKIIGTIHDIELSQGPEYRVIALLFGRSGLFHRLHVLNPFQREPLLQQEHNRIPWEAVDRFERPFVRLKPDVDLPKATPSSQK